MIRPIAGDLPTTSTSQTMWLRVECYNSSGDKVDVKCIVNDGATPTEQNWADATVYFRQTNFTNIAGGRVGFAIGSVYIDDLTIKSDADGDGEFTNDSTTEAVEDFTETSGDGSDKLVHDATGNLTYDGKYEYAYDAWNRMVTVTRAWQGGGEGKTGSAIATMAYDGTNRRVSKTIDNSGDWNHTYNFYHDGQAPAGQAKMIETRNGSGQVIKQHVWGTQYVDESIQIGINTNPGRFGQVRQVRGTQYLGSGDIHEQVFVKSVADVFFAGAAHTSIRRHPIRERQYSTCVAGLIHLSEIAKRPSPLDRGPAVERPLPPCHRLAFRLSRIQL